MFLTEISDSILEWSLGGTVYKILLSSFYNESRKSSSYIKAQYLSVSLVLTCFYNDFP